jgi:hypothetical protein
MRLRNIVLAALVCLVPHSVNAQAATERLVAFGDIGIAKTADDEGVLGNGMSLSGGLGVRLSQKLTVQAILERIGYHRDVDYLRIEGRVIFAGVEASWLWKPGRVQPFVTVGAGFFNDDGTWIAASVRTDDRRNKRAPLHARGHDLVHRVRSPRVQACVRPRRVPLSRVARYWRRSRAAHDDPGLDWHGVSLVDADYADQGFLMIHL